MTSTNYPLTTMMVVLIGHAAYVWDKVPPDGRMLQEMLVTGLFAGGYLLGSYRIQQHTPLSHKKGKNVLFLFNMIVVGALLFWGQTIERLFQDIDALYLYEYIAMAPYIVVYGLGLVGQRALSQRVKKQ